MNALTGIEGGLTVGILVVDATVADVRLRSSRPTNIGAMLAGRPMGEALSLVPMLFSLCGIAQGIAAVNACEAAIGITASPAQQAARDSLILGEMADSHAWQIAMEWPRLIGGRPRSQPAFAAPQSHIRARSRPLSIPRLDTSGRRHSVTGCRQAERRPLKHFDGDRPADRQRLFQRSGVRMTSIAGRGTAQRPQPD